MIEDEDLDTEIIHRIVRIEKTGRVYRNGKVYKAAVVQLTMVYGAETWALKKAQEKKKMDVALYIEAVHKH